MNAWILIYAIGAAQGVLLAIALGSRCKRSDKCLLACWMLLTSLDLSVRALYMAYPGPELLKAFRVVYLFPFLHAALFFLYLRSLTTRRPLLMRDGLHFAGFVLAILVYLDLFLLDADATRALFQALRAGNPPARGMYVDLAMFVYCLSYVGAALWLLARYRKQLLSRQSDAGPESLRWILTMSLCQIVIWAIAVGQWLTSLPWLSYQLIYAAVSVWVLLLGYLGLTQSPLPALAAPANRQESEVCGVPDSTEDPRFPDVVTRLNQLMDEQALFLQPALSIGQLAKRSGYPEYLVSEAINRRFECNFWEYINRYRVEAACACLADRQDQRTTLDIAYACGFTSKSTFNAAFKRLCGQTPSEYRRQQTAQDADEAASSRASTPPSAAD